MGRAQRVEDLECVLCARDLGITDRLLRRRVEAPMEKPRLFDRCQTVVGALHDEEGRCVLVDSVEWRSFLPFLSVCFE